MKGAWGRAPIETCFKSCFLASAYRLSTSINFAGPCDPIVRSKYPIPRSTWDIEEIGDSLHSPSQSSGEVTNSSVSPRVFGHILTVAMGSHFHRPSAARGTLGGAKPPRCAGGRDTAIQQQLPAHLLCGSVQKGQMCSAR